MRHEPAAAASATRRSKRPTREADQLIPRCRRRSAQWQLRASMCRNCADISDRVRPSESTPGQTRTKNPSGCNSPGPKVTGKTRRRSGRRGGLSVKLRAAAFETARFSHSRTSPVRGFLTCWTRPTQPARLRFPMVRSEGKKGTRSSRLSKARLDELVEQATVDGYGESEQRTAFLGMLQGHLELPFKVQVLGIRAMIEAIDLTPTGEIVAICRRGRALQRIPILELRLPTPPPRGAEWTAAYRRGAGA